MPTDFPRSVVSGTAPMHASDARSRFVPAGMERRWDEAPEAQTVDTSTTGPIRIESAGMPAGRRPLTIVRRGEKFTKAPLTETRDTLVSGGKRRIMARSGNQDFAAVGVRADGMWGEMGADPVPVQATRTDTLGTVLLLAGLAFVGYTLVKA